MGMVVLTRRLDRNFRAEHWLIFYADIEVGLIGIRAGVPVHVNRWGWRCGFYPATHRGIRAEGTAADFAQARSDFERTWCELLSKITEEDFVEHRRERAMMAWKYEMWDAGCRLPTQLPELKSVCFCGAEIDVRGVPEHVYAEHLPSHAPSPPCAS